MKQDSFNCVVSGMQALSLLSNMIEKSKDGEQMKVEDFNLVLRQISSELISTQQNNLDTSSAKSQFKTDICKNISVSTDSNDNFEDDSPMSTDSEVYDSDDQSEPEIDYQQELLSRMMYYGEHETEIKTLSKSRFVPSSRSTPLASSTMIEDCSMSTLRNNKRRKDRSTPLASSTMLEDQFTVEDNYLTETQPVVTWSTDDDNTKTESILEYYERYFGVNSSDTSSEYDCEQQTKFWMHTYDDLSTSLNAKDCLSDGIDSKMASGDVCNRNQMFPRTSTCSDLVKNIACKFTDEKKKSKRKQPLSRLVTIIRNIRRNIRKDNLLNEKRRR